MTQAIKVGNKVRFINAEKHEQLPQFYPEVGTIGRVLKVLKYDLGVEWEKGTTLQPIEKWWWCEKDWVEVVE